MFTIPEGAHVQYAAVSCYAIELGGREMLRMFTVVTLSYKSTLLAAVESLISIDGLNSATFSHSPNLVGIKGSRTRDVLCQSPEEQADGDSLY